ncbi:MAG: hypothetical protein WEH44_01640, partial [Pirellulaceae bacterium]
PSGLQQILNLAGWDTERWATFRDGQPLSADETQDVLLLLMRMQSFDDESIARWSDPAVRRENLVAAPQDHRGQMVHFEGGRVRTIERRELPPADAERLGFPAYFECQVERNYGSPLAIVLTPRVPRAWAELESLDEPVMVSGLFVKLAPAEGEQVPLLVAKRIVWRPERVREPYVSFGETVLAGLGVDVGLLEDVVNRQPILPQEREVFYQILAAMGQIPPQELVRLAEGQLPVWHAQWQAEKDRLIAAGAKQNDGRLLLAEAVLARVLEGAYSVAPLFNDSDAQFGTLVVVDGVARRAVRVEVGTTPDGQPSDVQRRFGISDYFELEVFTDDSQNLPLVFCVRKLPAGFPTGDDIREPVRVAGFFFKTWRYQARKPADGATAETQAQVAPLLIGSAPVRLILPESSSHLTELVAGT